MYPSAEAMNSGRRPTRSDSAPMIGTSTTKATRQIVPIHSAVARGIFTMLVSQVVR